MTENRAIAVNDYTFTSTDKLFLDANIWLYLYGPQEPRNAQAKIYSEALGRIIKAQSRVYVDVLIVSEFINAYARRQWRLLAPRTKKFKRFRSSQRFKQIAPAIADGAKRVLSHCSRLESGFGVLAIEDLLATYAAGNSDFNDQVIVELCKRKGLKLMTHDRDFKGREIPILTANPRLLN